MSPFHFFYFVEPQIRIACSKFRMKFRMGDANDQTTGEYTIIGVVKDFHYESLHKDIDSFMFFNYLEAQQVYNNLNIKIRPQNVGETLAAIEEKWTQFLPGQPFSYYFLDDRLNELYNNEKASNQIFNVFSILTIFIACVGLFGLSASRLSRPLMLSLSMPSGRSEVRNKNLLFVWD